MPLVQRARELFQLLPKVSGGVVVVVQVDFDFAKSALTE